MERLNCNRFNGKVHSVFRQAVNIVEADGDLYSLVTEKLDNAPHTLRITISGHEDLTSLGIQPGAVVCTKNAALFVANIVIDLKCAKVWHEPLPAFPSGTDLLRLEKNLEVLRQTIRLYGQAGGLRGLLDSGTEAPRDVFARVLKERGSCLIDALKNRDLHSACSIGRSLLGLGGGHTPSGDDFCAGLLAVMSLPDGPFDEEFQEFGHYLANEAKKQTTEISHAMLVHAAEGRVREKIGRLLRVVIHGCQEDTIEAAHQVLAIGSLSGTDLAVGLAAGLEVGIRMREGEKEENNGNTNYY